jgi:peptide/nickel transport system permease protein
MYLRTREILTEEYVLAARSLGAAPSAIARRHLLPALLPLALLKAPVVFAHALMAEATLSFIGVGAPIGRETWGLLLAQGKDYLIESPHIALASDLPLALTVFGLQMITSAKSDSRLES